MSAKVHAPFRDIFRSIWFAGYFFVNHFQSCQPFVVASKHYKANEQAAMFAFRFSDFPLARSILLLLLLFSLFLHLSLSLFRLACLHALKIQARVVRNLVYSHAHVLASPSPQMDFVALKL